MSEAPSNYFKVASRGQTRRADIFPFTDGDLSSTQAAWNAASKHGERVLAWKMPKCLVGPWTDCALVGEVGLSVEQMRAGFKRQLPRLWRLEGPPRDPEPKS